MLTPYPDSLVLFRGQPARVLRVAKTLEIELPGGRRLAVRSKDVQVLHPGPLRSLDGLEAPTGDVDTAWELLAGGTTTLAELAELAYGSYSPATAWAAWQTVADGVYFRGGVDRVVARTADEVARELEVRRRKADQEDAWQAFVERIRANRWLVSDAPHLRETEDLALGRGDRSRLLRELGRPQSPQAAHGLLLELGVWDFMVDPHPQRLGLPMAPALLAVPPLAQEERVDLTHIPAFAIDDEGTQEPDDAVSLEGGRLWVHVADAAALVSPDCTLDIEARSRGATLYLPEGVATMLPPNAIGLLGLGLSAVSPALSLGLDVDDRGQIGRVEIVPSWVTVSRLTYEQAETRLDEQPFCAISRLTRAHLERRRERGAILIDLPEVKIRVAHGQVLIQPLAPLRSRDLVAETMLMAGEGVARYASKRGIPVPFTTQEPAGTDVQPHDLAGMRALRQNLRPSQQSTVAGPHAGAGLEYYVQCTSPLRRYLDLVVHQQLRACLAGEELLATQRLVERIGAAVAMSSVLRQAERLARLHWTLVYLLQNPDWRGQGILVEAQGRRARVLVPELDLETQVHLRSELPLNSAVRLCQAAVNLPDLSVRFAVEGS